MKLETNLVHENGQYIHDGDPLYEGDKFIGRFRGLHDDGGPIQMVNVERPSGGGVTPFYIGVVEHGISSRCSPASKARARAGEFRLPTQRRK